MSIFLKETDCWDTIKNSGKPVILYGMGNGADMIIDVLHSYKIEYADVFASDKFVRGHFFHGKKVLRYSEVCEKYDDFIVVMTFAVRDKESLENVRKISREHTLVSPTVPVAGKGLFTKEFIAGNIEKVEKVYSLLADDLSRKTYLDVINFKISGNTDYLFDCFFEKEKVYSDIFSFDKQNVILDLGAYDGDTVQEFYEFSKEKYEKIIAIEPDKKNFKKLLKNTDNYPNIERHNIGIWNENTEMLFSQSAGRQSRIGDKGEMIEVRNVDSFIDENISLIKMDVEGCELRALQGAKQVIQKYHPNLYVCAYHRNEDIFTLPLLINEYDSSYKIYFRQHPYIPSWECNFYAI